jgi:hypothetical protein
MRVKQMMAGLALVGVIAGCGTAGGNQVGTVGPSGEVVNAQPQGVIPQPKDFKLTVRVVKKDCFGADIPCSVEYKINVAYGGPDLDPSTTWVVTYETSGMEDGPAIATFSLTGRRVEQDGSSFAQIKPKGVLRAKVTSVLVE